MPVVLVSTSSFGEHDRRPLELLEQAGFEVRGNPHRRKLTLGESRELLAPEFGVPAVGVVAGTETFSRELLAAAPQLQVISRCGVGMDGIDAVAAAEREITVLRTTDAHVEAVAELTLGGMLAVLRHLATVDRKLRAGDWHKVMGRQLAGKTVGIIGLGRTGRRLVELLAPFQVELLAHDPDEDRDFADAHGVTYTPVATVVAAGDILTLHLDYSPSVHHLLDRETIDTMKPGAIVVNTARGGLIDERALAEALRAGRLGGAFLDVFEQEPYSGPLTALDNVLLTAHIGSYALEGRIAMETEAAQNLIDALRERRS